MAGPKEAAGSVLFQQKRKGPLLPGEEASVGIAFVVKFLLLCAGHSANGHHQSSCHSFYFSVTFRPYFHLYQRGGGSRRL